ncbi:MAG TPA: dTDP-glucose 4,6-dehydratase [Candidatus Peribacteraceae bacterium]|nr:dTDP-glucose 4,6-dehydratase [Candidatus Peribacteraceae bacterium]
MRLLVTGGCGFIGSHFIRTVLRERPQWEVVNLDALTYAGNLVNVADIQADSRYKFVYGSITDQAVLNAIVPTVDHVVNFAAETHVDRSIHDNEPFILTNVLGVQRLIDACVRYNKSLHHVSTDEVFGELEAGESKFTEESPYRPRNPYSATKAAADHLVRAAINTQGLCATISNCTNNYGPYLYPEKFLSIAITNLLEGFQLPIHGDGRQVRDWIQVEDHARGILLILEKGQAGETYIMGGNAEYSIVDTARLLLSLMGLREDRLQFITDRPGQDRRYAIDFSKIQRQLGWAPQHSFESGLHQMIGWYQHNHSWWKPIKESAAYRQWYAAHFGLPQPARTDPFGTGGPAVTQDFVQSIAAPDSASLASSGKPVVPQPVEHLIPSQMPLAEGRSAALTTGVVIFGGDGYLGEYLRAIYPEAQCPKVDIGDRAAVVRVLDEYRPAVIINAAGKTGRPNVDWCEDHKEETLHSNVLGPLILWEECDKRGIYMAHLGSGCIYEGDNLGHGFGESDAPNFNGSFYSRTKRWSDEMLQEFPVLIARLRMPFDGSQHERNLLSKLLRYKKITTAHNSLSFLPDFFYALQVLIAQRATGAYNIVNPGAISPYEIMLMYREIVDPAHTFEPLDVKDILTQVKVERSNCVLSTAKIESAGIFLPTAEARIRQILEEWKRMPREVGDMQYVV